MKNIEEIAEYLNLLYACKKLGEAQRTNPRGAEAAELAAKVRAHYARGVS